MLDDLELPHVQEIATRDRRALAEHRAPGMDGSYLQNLGRSPVRVVLWGVAAGPEAVDLLERLDRLFQAAEPVPFLADVVADAEIQEVLIEDFRCEEVAGRPDRFAYLLTLDEYIEPIDPPSPLAGGLDGDILGDAAGLVDDLVDGLDLGLGLDTGLDRFVQPLTSLLGRLQQLKAATGGDS